MTALWHGKGLRESMIAIPSSAGKLATTSAAAIAANFLESYTSPPELLRREGRRWSRFEERNADGSA